jgi:hypothetical protein
LNKGIYFMNKIQVEADISSLQVHHGCSGLAVIDSPSTSS